ncbi:MAG: sulfatase-like hydrolase/transferase [Candidatus Aminicenantes bacterium]|nr:sulfatase-like hydrolase/transferase [Candidatus Aminicenantes bacterium]
MPIRTAGGKKKAGRTKLFLLLSLIALIIIPLIAYFLLSSGIPSQEARAASEIKKLLAPLNPRELNIVFFTLDTTRADHLACYGYPLIETGNIDRLAAQGFLFKHTTSQAPLTLPSHASIFTGTYPFYHGVRDNGGFYLERDKTTLAKVVQQAGWATSAFIGAFVLDSRWGIDQGFDYYYDHFDFSKYKTISLDSVRRKGGEVVQAFFDWLQENRHKKFFSWIHLYDPHSPYEPPEPFKTRYGNRPGGLYDAEIAYVDSLVGDVVKELEKDGLLKKTLIIIAADHGESLGEHHESGHGFFLYDATQSVPLIIRIPSQGFQGRVVEPQVRNVDIMPSLLELLGLPIPKEVQGRSFLDLMAGRGRGPERLAYSETYYPRYHYGWSELKSLRSSRYKFIQAPSPELYDLVRDPREQDNIYGRNLEEGKVLEREIQDLQRKGSAKGIEDKGPKNLDLDTKEKLMALGYIGGFTSSSKMAKSGTLGDPKDKIILYNKIRQAEGASANREFGDALKLLDEVLVEDPGIMEARHVRATVYLQLDRAEEAVAECREALKVDEEYEAAIFTMARAYKSLKKYDEAIAGYGRIIQLNPRDPGPYVSLGDIYCDIKDFDKAIANLQTAISLDPEHSALAHNLLGSAYLEKNMLEPAEKELTLALQDRPKIPDAHYNLGILYEHTGDVEKAILEYRKEIEIHSGAYPAHFNLALIYAKRGLLREEVAELQEVITANQKFARSYLFLAKAYLDLNENFDEAISLAKKGLELEPEAESAPLGHFVLADIYNRLGRWAEYSAEVEKGRAIEQKLKRGRPQAGTNS